jgi:hypothetical protein
MKLSEEERNVIVTLRLQKAKDTLGEAKGNIKLGYWHTAVNRNSAKQEIMMTGLFLRQPMCDCLLNPQRNLYIHSKNLSGHNFFNSAPDMLSCRKFCVILQR